MFASAAKRSTAEATEKKVTTHGLPCLSGLIIQGTFEQQMTQIKTNIDIFVNSRILDRFFRMFVYIHKRKNGNLYFMHKNLFLPLCRLFL